MGIWALACAPVATQVPGCVPVGSVSRLPGDLQEASGVTLSPGDPDVLWMNNDGDSQLFAIDREGRQVGRFPMRTRGIGDMEDIAAGTCANGGSCLYIADTGDNDEQRDPGDIRLLRVREPDPEETAVLDPESFPMRLPDGPRDIEAVFVLPGERPYFVTKGRSDPVTVYRYPPPLRPDTVTLEEVQRLTDARQPLLAQVTGASLSPSGSRVAVRTYRGLSIYALEGDSLATVAGGFLDLTPIQEFQGEGVALGEDGLIFLTSEGGPLGGDAVLRALRCEVAGG